MLQKYLKMLEKGPEILRNALKRLKLIKNAKEIAPETPINVLKML